MDETSYLRYMRLAGNGAADANRGINVPVRLKLIDETKFSHEGKTDFVDNAIDRASGTIRGRAEFANPNATFTPGMFARVKLIGSGQYDALLINDSAIGTDQSVKFVLRVGADNKIEYTPVKLGLKMG